MSNQAFPNPAAPLVGAQGTITEPWRRLLQDLWSRTGGAAATLYALLAGNANQTFEVATATTSTQAVPLAQAEALANTAQTNAEDFTSASYAPLASPAFTGTPTVPTAAAGTATTQAASTAFAQGAADTAQSNAETYAAAQAATAQSNAETYALSQIQTGTGGAPTVPTVGASPYTYTATAVGTLVIEAGTVTGLTLTRGTATVTLSASTPLVPLDNADEVAITYSAAPTVTFIPR